MTTIAIDPGASGGLAWTCNLGVACCNMPETTRDLVDLFKEILREGPCTIVQEDVGGYVGGAGAPGSAMFNFGKGVGELLGVATALDIPVHLVKPQKWQKALSLGTSKSHASKSAWKTALKGKAQQLYPTQKVTLATADALLILNAAMKGLL